MLLGSLSQKTSYAAARKLKGLETEFTTRGNILVEKQEAVNKANEELMKTKEIYDQLINVQLANVGINEKGAEGVAQLDQAISKTQTRITELQTAKTEQGGLNDQQQLELETLQGSLSTQKQSKEEIKRIQGEQASVNAKVEEGRKKAEGMTKELAKDVKKNVDVDDRGKAKKISDEAAKPIKKDVTLNAVWTGIKHALKVALPNYFAARNEKRSWRDGRRGRNGAGASLFAERILRYSK